MMFNRQVLDIDPREESDRIGSLLIQTIRNGMHRNGAVVGISGGVDSSVVFALTARSLGAERVRAVMMPEKDSDVQSEVLACELARHYGVEPVLENITACLAGFGCYRRRDDAIRRVFPEYDAARGYRAKISLPPNLLDEDTLNVFSLTILRPGGDALTKLLPPREFREIVGASNFKQRTRMAMLYYYAELNNYAVVGTANKNEHDQGFFVKYGDGGVDVAPIEHLYKTQVYQLAEFLGVPAEIRRRTPTSDTYSAPSTQEEFFFRLPFEVMDLLWFGLEHKIPAFEVASVMKLSEDQVVRAYSYFASKRRTTEYLRMQPVGFAKDDSNQSEHLSTKRVSHAG
jgi:NAD+ synthase